MRYKKLQSAMEYLMTYGWSILILAFVLAALFELGVFTGGFGGASSCVSEAGFLCTQISENANIMNSNSEPSVSLTIGEVGQTWTNVYIISAPQGIQPTNNLVPPAGFFSNPSNCNIPSFSNCYNYFMLWGEQLGQYAFLSSLASGQQVTVTFWTHTTNPGVAGPIGHLGERIAGSVWAMYSTPYTTNTIAEIGSYIVVADTNTTPN